MSRFPFPPYPNGWFVVGFSEELPPGGVLLRHYFGRDIVLYRTDQGEARATDPHCPHLGAHLGHGGRVVGETLRCPFHGWCFDGAGRCVSVPRVNRPPRVSVPVWPLREQGGLLHVYHHAGGAAPDWEVPSLDDDGEWSPDRKVQWRVRTHPQEIIENGFDIAHFSPLHGMVDMRVVRPPSDEGPVMRMRIGGIAPGEQPGDEFAVEVAIHGLGILSVETVGTATRTPDRHRLYLTPVDGELLDLRAVVNVQRLSDPDLTAQAAQSFYETFVGVITADFPIWENKRYVEHPPLTRVDGPIGLFRAWARRFYST